MKKTIVLLTLFLAFFGGNKVKAQISVGISVHVAPPAIPVYEQPPCPVDGYIWIPGYWAWDDAEGYYWVPGYWEAPPEVGFLWTPGYWGWSGGVYLWHAGYWGPHVGFYGGVNYGCGYGGFGYSGGEWYGGHFRYNTAVTRVNTRVIHNTYVNRTVIVNNGSRTSYNGGPHGIQARPNAAQEAAMHDHHIAPTAVQTQHREAAHQERNSFANVNHGRPATAAVARPMAFHGAANRGVAPANRTVNRPQPQMHARSQTHAQPQMHAQPQGRPMNQPRPQQHAPVARPMPAQHGAPHGVPSHGAPHGAPPHGEPPHGGGGGEHHHR